MVILTFLFIVWVILNIARKVNEKAAERENHRQAEIARVNRELAKQHKEQQRIWELQKRERAAREKEAERLRKEQAKERQARIRADEKLKREQERLARQQAQQEERLRKLEQAAMVAENDLEYYLPLKKALSAEIEELREKLEICENWYSVGINDFNYEAAKEARDKIDYINNVEKQGLLAEIAKKEAKLHAVNSKILKAQMAIDNFEMKSA